MMSRYLSRNLRKRSEGFTLIELLIATSVLSIILLLVTVIIINIGSLYQKGVNSSTVQDDARSIIDQVSQQIQFSAYTPTDVTYTTELPAATPTTASAPNDLCINGYRNTFVINQEKLNGTAEVFWAETNQNDIVGTLHCNMPLTTGELAYTNISALIPGKELMARNTSLQYFNVTQGQYHTYRIDVTVAAGDISDLATYGQNAACRGGVGEQFCSTASLSTTVVPRL